MMRWVAISTTGCKIRFSSPTPSALARANRWMPEGVAEIMSVEVFDERERAEFVAAMAEIGAVVVGCVTA